MPRDRHAVHPLAVMLCCAALGGCDRLLPYRPSASPDQLDTGTDLPLRDARQDLVRKDLPVGDAPRDARSERREAGAPQIVTLYSTKDTMIDLQGADANYGSCAEIFMQNAWDTAKGRIEEYRVLFFFDLSSIPQVCKVNAATLVLSIKDTNGDTPVTLNQLSEDWDEGAGSCGGAAGCASWNDRKKSTAWSKPGGGAFSALDTVTIPDPASTLAWPAQTLVQGWVAQPPTNRGLILTTSYVPPSTHFVDFYAREAAQAFQPRLTVTFTCP